MHFLPIRLARIIHSSVSRERICVESATTVLARRDGEGRSVAMEKPRDGRVQYHEDENNVSL